MLAAFDGLDYFADIRAVFDHGVIGLQVLERNLMADGDVVQSRAFDSCIAVHDPAGQDIAFFDAVHHDHADAVAGLMHYKMRCHMLLLKKPG